MTDIATQATTLPNTTDLPEIDLSDYRLTPKFNVWQQLYLDQANKETFGNGTQAAIIAYKLNPQTQYGSAKVIAHENITKLNRLRLTVRQYLDNNGFTLPVLINHALEKMASPKITSDHWWKNLLVLAGYIDPKQQVTINNTNNAQATARAEATRQNDFTQISPEEEKQLSREFAEFIDAKYRGTPAMNPDAI